MRLSGFHMPRWWQACWRARYPMGVHGGILLTIENPAGPHPWSMTAYRVEPMPCGCGYIVHNRLGDRVGPHYSTLGRAIRAARKDAASYAREPQV